MKIDAELYVAAFSLSKSILKAKMVQKQPQQKGPYQRATGATELRGFPKLTAAWKHPLVPDSCLLLGEKIMPVFLGAHFFTLRTPAR